MVTNCLYIDAVEPFLLTNAGSSTLGSVIHMWVPPKYPCSKKQSFHKIQSWWCSFYSYQATKWSFLSTNTSDTRSITRNSCFDKPHYVPQLLAFAIYCHKNHRAIIICCSTVRTVSLFSLGPDLLIKPDNLYWMVSPSNLYLCLKHSSVNSLWRG